MNGDGKHGMNFGGGTRAAGGVEPVPPAIADAIRANVGSAARAKAAAAEARLPWKTVPGRRGKKLDEACRHGKKCSQCTDDPTHCDLLPC